VTRGGFSRCNGMTSVTWATGGAYGLFSVGMDIEHPVFRSRGPPNRTASTSALIQSEPGAGSMVYSSSHFHRHLSDIGHCLEYDGDRVGIHANAQKVRPLMSSHLATARKSAKAATPQHSESLPLHPFPRGPVRIAPQQRN
jgi:hypothetical protein